MPVHTNPICGDEIRCCGGANPVGVASTLFISVADLDDSPVQLDKQAGAPPSEIAEQCAETVEHWWYGQGTTTCDEVQKNVEIWMFCCPALRDWSLLSKVPGESFVLTGVFNVICEPFFGDGQMHLLRGCPVVDDNFTISE